MLWEKLCSIPVSVKKILLSITKYKHRSVWVVHWFSSGWLRKHNEKQGKNLKQSFFFHTRLCYLKPKNRIFVTMQMFLCELHPITSVNCMYMDARFPSLGYLWLAKWRPTALSHYGSVYFLCFLNVKLYISLALC